MASFPDLYPAACYLLPLEKRLRYRDAGGRLDPSAVASAARLLPVIVGLDEVHKVRVGSMLKRLQKAIIVIGPEGLNPGGEALDESFGFPMVIEVPEGGTRSGTSADGAAWSRPMTGAGYGFLPGTCAADREEVDVYRGPVPAAQAPLAFVVSQVGSDPERKLMVGFATAADAIRCYLANVPAEMFGDLHALPLAIIGELLGYEPEAPGALSKALEAGTSTTGASVLITKSGATVASFTRVEVDGDAAIQKRAVDSLVEKNGFLLSGKGSPRSWKANLREVVRCAVEPLQAAAGLRLAKALDSATIYQGQTTPLAMVPELAGHASLTAPLSGTYDNPADVGGWIGWIENDAETWIAFVDVAGKALLWTQREPDGGIIGDPVTFERADLVAPAAGPDEERAKFAQMYGLAPDLSARKAVSLPVHILPITKGLDASTPKEKRIVVGVVLEPEPFNGAGDAHDETYSAEEIERAAHAYLMSYGNLNDSHGRFISTDRAAVCQSYIAPQDLLIGGSTIKAGAWVLAAKIFDDVLWGRVLTGEIGAWSIEGYAERTPNVGPPVAPTMAA